MAKRSTKRSRNVTVRFKPNPFGLSRARSDALMGMLGSPLPLRSRETGSSSRPGKSTVYKGVRIYQGPGGWSTSVEPESRFETVTDAKRFVRAWLKGKANPLRLSKVKKSLLDWSARNFGYDLAESEPTMADIDKLTASETILQVPKSLKLQLLKTAQRAYRQRRPHAA